MFNWLNRWFRKKPKPVVVDYDYSGWKPVSRIFRQKHADVQVFEARTYMYIMIIDVDVDRRKQGIGSSVMKRILWYAKRFNKDVVLEASDALGTSLNDLFEFYGNHGFEQGKIERIHCRHNMYFKVLEN